MTRPFTHPAGPAEETWSTGKGALAAAIEVQGLRKTYAMRKPVPRRRDRRRPVVEAVRGIDLSVPSGEIFGFLGPNGAGKTTTVRLLTTLLTPDSGTATVAGYDLLSQPHEVRRRIGYVSQYGGMNPATCVRANLLLQVRLFGLTGARAQRRADAMLGLFGLEDLAGRRVSTLSGGQARKLALAVGLAHAPDLLFLDEPTLGLDPRARADLWQEIRGLRERGCTVFLTSHYLDEVDSLCDRLAIIDQGKIMVHGTPNELKRTLSPDVLRLRLSKDPGASAEALSAGLPSVRSVRSEGRGLRLYTDDGERALPAALRALEAQGLAVDTVALSRPSLDDVFLHHTGRSLGCAPEAAG
ncbi:ATP-binding cassette domain-containing protein [Streptomyces cucumeris]|uniref:ATP-binding cassette domain-containing protein n=1 Tax=Streptomyces cucumeris TaxID=2962890 RepID=UPI003D757DAB